MPTEKQIVFIEPPKEPINQTGHVTTESFFQFLYGQMNFPYRSWEFAPNLYLPGLQPLMQELYDTTQEVFIIPEERRKAWREYFGKNINEESIKWLEEKGHGERTTTLYYDYDDLKLYTSQVAHGEHGSANALTLEVYQDVGVPLIEAHTHPDESLPTPVDFIRLFAQGYDTGRRIVQGILVLTPSRQILALPTAKTPLLSLEEAVEFTEEKENQHIAKLDLLHQKRQQRIIAYGNKINQRYAEIINNLLQKKATGELSDEEVKRLANEYSNYGISWSKFVNNRINISYGKRINYVANTLLMDFLREIHVQLYISTDMNNFMKATA